MKTSKITSALVVSMLFAAPVLAEEMRNLSGAWETPQGDNVVIAHHGQDVAISYSIDDDEVGLQIIPFDGRVMEFNPDNGEFMLSGINNTDKQFRVSHGGKRCIAQDFIFATRGYMVGQFGGRRIHMAECSILVHLVCSDKSEDWATRSCKGTWK